MWPLHDSGATCLGALPSERYIMHLSQIKRMSVQQAKGLCSRERYSDGQPPKQGPCQANASRHSTCLAWARIEQRELQDANAMTPYTPQEDDAGSEADLGQAHSAELLSSVRLTFQSTDISWARTQHLAMYDRLSANDNVMFLSQYQYQRSEENVQQMRRAHNILAVEARTHNTKSILDHIQSPCNHRKAKAQPSAGTISRLLVRTGLPHRRPKRGRPCSSPGQHLFGRKTCAEVAVQSRSKTKHFFACFSQKKSTGKGVVLKPFDMRHFGQGHQSINAGGSYWKTLEHSGTGSVP